MKNLLSRITLLLLLSATMIRCSEDEQAPSQESVAVTFSFSAAPAANGRVKAETPDVLYLSLTENTGEPVITYQKVKILSVGESYISEPVNLPAGSYKISDFILADEASDSVLFATPKKGSALAKFVSRPLPYGIVVAKDKVVNIAMEVIDVSASSPADFGYTAFQITPLNPLSLSVLVQSGSNTTLVTARAFLLTGSDTTKVYELGAKVNALGIPGDPQITHTLVVVKPGYGVYKQELKYSDLTSKSIMVLMKPAFSFVVTEGGGEGDYQIGLGGVSGGTVYIDWGDGTPVESHQLLDYFGSASHHFDVAGDHAVNITGDLDQVERFGAYYQLLYVDLYRLTGLKDLYLGISNLKLVDMSENTNLEKVWIESMLELEDVILPEQHFIRDIKLIQMGLITTPIIDKAINSIYNNAVGKGIVNGNFELFNYGWLPNGPIGPPSPGANAQLTELHNEYGWVINPLP